MTQTQINEHLSSLQYLLSNERIRLSNAKTEGERELRQVWVNQLEKEVAREREFLGIDANVCEMTDDELLKELN